MEVTTLPTVATANHAAVSAVLDRLRQGTLAPNVPPVDLASVVGAGQSLGGHALVVMQSSHRTFDGVAMLGSSMAGTTMPVRPGAPEAVAPDGTTPEQAALLTLANTDWNWVFHWEGTPMSDIPRTPGDGVSLVAADIAGGLPARQTAPEWGSLTSPGFGAASMLPGVVAGEAARINVPVLLATGERDVCRPPADEVAAFKAATDISVFVVPRMAHMHNWDGVMPITGPSPADSQARAPSASTRVLPDPAGALMTDTRLPSVSTDRAAAAWSAQPGPRALVLRVVRAAGQRVLEPLLVRAERPRQREHALFHGQLRARGIAHSPVPLVDAAPVGAQQTARHLDRLGCLQAQDRLEL
jgi:pimeloyl-ACP methyl ester carboxylesterase